MTQNTAPQVRTWLWLLGTVMVFNEINPELVVCSYVPEPGVEPGVPKAELLQSPERSVAHSRRVSDGYADPDNIGTC